MTIREILQNKDINLDDELYVCVMSLDTHGDYYPQAFPITSVELEGHDVMLTSSDLDKYESSWLM